MLSLGLLFFSLVEIMVPRAPQAVVGGGELSPGGTRCWATAGGGKGNEAQAPPMETEARGEGCPHGLPCALRPCQTIRLAAPPHPEWGSEGARQRRRGRLGLRVSRPPPSPASGRRSPEEQRNRGPEEGGVRALRPQAPHLALRGSEGGAGGRGGRGCGVEHKARPLLRGGGGEMRGGGGDGGDPARPETLRPSCDARG